MLNPLGSIFPLVEVVEFAALVADIQRHGLHERVVLFEDKLLDGRNRMPHIASDSETSDCIADRYPKRRAKQRAADRQLTRSR